MAGPFVILMRIGRNGIVRKRCPRPAREREGSGYATPVLIISCRSPKAPSPIFSQGAMLAESSTLMVVDWAREYVDVKVKGLHVVCAEFPLRVWLGCKHIVGH